MAYIRGSVLSFCSTNGKARSGTTAHIRVSVVSFRSRNGKECSAIWSHAGRVPPPCQRVLPICVTSGDSRSTYYRTVGICIRITRRIIDVSPPPPPPPLSAVAPQPRRPCRFLMVGGFCMKPATAFECEWAYCVQSERWSRWRDWSWKELSRVVPAKSPNWAFAN
ncbi:unnamed protein product, partial [Iphiclides podalirius]